MAGAIPDDFWVEWHPTRSPFLDVADADWVPITNGIRELHCDHGFERDLARVETGTALVTFDNRDRSLDPSNPYAPNVGGFTPLRHVRIMATTGADTLVIWRGFTVDWRPDWDIDDAWVVLECKDSLMAAAKHLRENTLSTAIGALNPEFWLPLDDGGTALAQARDAADQDAVMTSTSATGNILPFGDQATTTFPHPIYSKGVVVTTNPTFAVNPAGFTILVVFKTERPEPQVMFAAGPDPATGACPSGDVALVVDAGATVSLRVGNNGGSSLLQFPRPKADPSSLVIARYNPTNTTILASKGYGTIHGGPVANSTIGGTWAPRAGKVNIGAGLDAANANPFFGQLSHVAFWNAELTDTQCFTLFSGYFGATRNIFTLGQNRANEAIGWVLDRLGIPIGRRDFSTGTIGMGGMNNDLTALEMMSRAAATNGGFFFADRLGRYAFWLGSERGLDLGTYDTRPADSGGVNRAAAGLRLAHDDRTFRTVARMQVTTAAEPQVVELRHANADSSTGFGEVIYEPPTTFGNRDDAMAAAVAAVGDGTPHLAVVELEVQMGAHNVDPVDLLISDVLDTVDTVARIPGKVGPIPALLPHEQHGLIVKVSHDYSRGHHWRTKWDLVPD